MTEDRKKYTCNKCKCVYHLTKPNRFCGCGGLLVCEETVKDLFDALFKGFKK